MTSFLTGNPSSVPAIGAGDIVVNNRGKRGQSFRTYSLPNFQLALYTLQIRSPMYPNSLVDTFTFPLSPEGLRKEYDDLTNFYDVAGDTTNYGVQRIIDVYGQTPPTFILDGTTGWKLHSMDGFKFTGLQAIARIESLLAEYATLNQQQLQNGNPNPYQLWFFDFFRNEYWQVFPIARQALRQSRSRPLYVSYSLRLVAQRRLDNPETQLPDNLAAQLSASAVVGSAVMQNFINSFGSYAGVTAIAQ